MQPSNEQGAHDVPQKENMLCLSPPIPGNSFETRLALPCLSDSMVYMTAPAAGGFGRLAFSESACCYHNHFDILTQVSQSSFYPRMIVAYLLALLTSQK